MKTKMHTQAIILIFTLAIATITALPTKEKSECTKNSDCSSNKACVGQQVCADPCPGECGYNAYCVVSNHEPICYCPPSLTGNPSLACNAIQHNESDTQPSQSICAENSDCSNELACLNGLCGDPCHDTCGYNAYCTVLHHQPVCTCAPNMTGNPLMYCQPDDNLAFHNELSGNGAVGSICTKSSECFTELACVRGKCSSPCNGTCGHNAICSIQNHNAVCNCHRGTSGDPYVSCQPREYPPVPEYKSNPCSPSPCGPNSICREINGSPSCSCVSEYLGHPPNCRPECTFNSDCPDNLSCINSQCLDACPRACGDNATCTIFNHVPVCTCTPDLTGNPYVRCHRTGDTKYISDRYFEKSNCIKHSDCDEDLACINQYCTDPCKGACSKNSLCSVIKHIPECVCPLGTTGNPFEYCHNLQSLVLYPVCDCGENAHCENEACLCKPHFAGDPYSDCRPECAFHSNCPYAYVCLNGKCIESCNGTCGIDAECEVFHRYPKCGCPVGMIGDPLVRCRNTTEEMKNSDIVNIVCSQSACGPYSKCTEHQGHAVCSCLPGYLGSPPTCRPECTENSECPENLACINTSCQDPCHKACYNCAVSNHSATCVCPPNWTGNPYEICYRIQYQDEENDACSPSPCGPNSKCKEINERPICTCLSGYIGSPPNCHPECDVNTDCADELACINNRCSDPCPASCGLNANCAVSKHSPACACPPDMTGDPFSVCQTIENNEI